jgi:CSLREA domain-containing protein
MRPSTRVVLALLASAMLAMPPAARGVGFTVDSAGDEPDGDVGDGACATTAETCTLRAALEQANALAGEPHTITLPAGTYSPATTSPERHPGRDGPRRRRRRPSSRVRPRSSAPLRRGGGWRAHAPTTCRSRARTSARSSALRASGGRLRSPAARSGNTRRGAGGGARGPLGSPATITVADTSFSNNTVGAALEVGTSCSLVLDGCTFQDNQQATNELGGASRSPPAAPGVASRSRAPRSWGTWPRAAAPSRSEGVSGTVAIAQSTFAGNLAQLGSFGGGGAIYSVKPGVAITDTTFSDNHATGSGYNGGAILSPGIAFTCTGCTFSGNTASGTGGAICATGMTLVNSTFYQNAAGSSGGAIFVDVPGLVTRCVPQASRSSATARRGGRRHPRRLGERHAEELARRTEHRADRSGLREHYDLARLQSDRRRERVRPDATTGDRIRTAMAPIAPGVDFFADYGGPTRRSPSCSAARRSTRAIPPGAPTSRRRRSRPTSAARARPLDGDGAGGAECDVGAYEAPTAPPTTTSTTLPGATTSTTTTIDGATTTTTSTTLPLPVCVGGTAIDIAVLTVKRVTPPSGDEVLVIRGSVSVPAGTPALFDPAVTGAQVLIEDVGGGGTAIFELSHRTTPIPGGAGCGARDGWKRLRYANASGSVDPPACTPGSAGGLRSLRFKDRRARGKGIAFALVAKRAQLGVPTGPFRTTVVLGASVTSSLVGGAVCGRSRPAIARRSARRSAAADARARVAFRRSVRIDSERRRLEARRLRVASGIAFCAPRDESWWTNAASFFAAAASNAFCLRTLGAVSACVARPRATEIRVASFACRVPRSVALATSSARASSRQRTDAKVAAAAPPGAVVVVTVGGTAVDVVTVLAPTSCSTS